MVYEPLNDYNVLRHDTDTLTTNNFNPIWAADLQDEGTTIVCNIKNYLPVDMA